MTSPTRQQRRPPNGAGLLLLFVVLGGVLGMHALDVHGVAGNHTGMTHHAATSAPAIRPGSSMMMSGTDQVHSSARRPAFSTPSSQPAPADDFSSAMSLCLGVLAASVLLLLARRAHGLHLVGLAPRWLSDARPSADRRRDRDPPSLALLSVRRC